MRGKTDVLPIALVIAAVTAGVTVWWLWERASRPFQPESLIGKSEADVITTLGDPDRTSALDSGGKILYYEPPDQEGSYTVTLWVWIGKDGKCYKAFIDD